MILSRAPNHHRHIYVGHTGHVLASGPQRYGQLSLSMTRPHAARGRASIQSAE